MILGKINCSKINKNRLFRGAKGIYLDIIFIPHANGRDQYGQDGFIAENVSKEQRAAGERGNILGYYTIIDRKQSAPAHQQSNENTPPAGAKSSDKYQDLPF